ncbi:MAG: NAD(P)/FAD-dependent oxidoreductase [Thermoanaerobaculum sp.]|nr:NAD(P)/FAD-dependent oxidoreductase [Thermoanaerobaculum sp.]MDW7968557.1 NAD(P)/FAD-dependent oxidoreductase [Thermoanaerobaculum sp.]
MRVVIVGGGFGGLALARRLRRAPLEVVLLDRRNFHLFQPLLYQVATGGLSAASVCTPLRYVFRGAKNVHVWLAKAVGLDPRARRLQLADGEIAYDLLVVAAGSRPHFFGHSPWAQVALPLKTVEDAAAIRSRVLAAFEQAEREHDPEQLRALMTFAIVGGGPTGVELAGALAEVARYTLRREFRRIEPSLARILLLEMAARILPGMPPTLSARAERTLRRLGVEVLTNTQVVEVSPAGLRVRRGVLEEELACGNVLWAAGVEAVPFVRAVARATGAATDRWGRILVNPDLTVPGFPEIFVLGDAAATRDENGQLLPAVAPVAVQQGRYVSQLIRARLRGKPHPPFRYRDWGYLATVGRHEAVGTLFGWKLWGWPAWLLWALVHLAKIVGFANRLLVLLQWAWAYLTFGRTARVMVEWQPAPSSEGNS